VASKDQEFCNHKVIIITSLYDAYIFGAEERALILENNIEALAGFLCRKRVALRREYTFNPFWRYSEKKLKLKEEMRVWCFFFQRGWRMARVFK